MTDDHIPTCGPHRTLMEWRATNFEYSEGGISISVPGVYAWVCPETGEASFTPETTDELIATVRELVESAKRARQRRRMPTEFIVKVG